jgi:hypothetical protein
MTPGRRAANCLAAVVMCIASAARAGVWGVDPVVGVIGDYATNPGLLTVPPPAEYNAALLLDAPTTYNGNAFQFSVVPSFRFADKEGYSSLASDYEHLTVKGEFDTDRSVWAMSAAANRDSSLYANYQTNGSTGVKRDTLMADLSWDRRMTDRVDLTADLDSVQVKYGEAVGVATLTDYRYSSFSPGVTWLESERTKLTLTANAGEYKSIDGRTESRSANLQAGFVHSFNELWTLTLNYGFSRALNTEHTYEEFLIFTPQGPAIEFVPVKIESSENGTVYSASLVRKSETLSLTAAASRQLVPTGYAYLSKQESAELTATYNYSTRWFFTADAHYIHSEDPQLQGGILERTPRYLSLNANWRWTEFWTVTFGASRVVDLFQPQDTNVSSNEVSIKLSRQFNHMKF